jgi:hypothetical protein
MLVCVFLQAPEQYVSPVPQVQAPLLQVAPPVQATPHAPQSRLSVRRFTHAPEQLANPFAHPQTPAAQL